MENPFSAPPAQLEPNPGNPPAIEPEPEAFPPPFEDAAAADADSSALPPEKFEDEELVSSGQFSALPVPANTETASEPNSFNKNTTESVFNLEADAQAMAVKPKPKPRPNPTPQVEEISPVLHHQQPLAYGPPSTVQADPRGWSDADFDDDDGSELPNLTMEERSCRMCKFFHFEEGKRGGVRFGECRKNAPNGVGKAVWPSVLWDSWCGEWMMGTSQDEMMEMARNVADAVKEE